MIEFLQYTFMQNALLAGILIAASAPLIGVFLVIKKYALIADTISHVSLSGVALGILIGINPVYTALLVAIIAAVLIEKLSSGKIISGESSLALFLSGGLALATVLLSSARGFSVDLFSYLFGSITTVTTTDLLFIFVLSLISIFVIYTYKKELLYTSFDNESAQVSGLPVKRLNYIFMILTAVVISVSLRVIGVLLISALMIIPVLTSGLIAKSFKQTIYLSVIFAELFVITGLLLSYYLNLASGGSIVLLSLIIFGIISFIKK